MKTQNRKPGWRQLIWLAPLMAGLLILDSHLALTKLAHQFIEVGIVLLMYGSLACWLWLNQEALESETDQPGGWQRIDPKKLKLPEERRLLAVPELDGAVLHPVTTRNRLDKELQQALHSPPYHCAPPSGARLN